MCCLWALAEQRHVLFVDFDWTLPVVEYESCLCRNCEETTVFGHGHEMGEAWMIILCVFMCRDVWWWASESVGTPVHSDHVSLPQQGLVWISECLKNQTTLGLDVLADTFPSHVINRRNVRLSCQKGSSPRIHPELGDYCSTSIKVLRQDCLSLHRSVKPTTSQSQARHPTNLVLQHKVVVVTICVHYFW